MLLEDYLSRVIRNIDYGVDVCSIIENSKRYSETFTGEWMPSAEYRLRELHAAGRETNDLLANISCWNASKRMETCRSVASVMSLAWIGIKNQYFAKMDIH